MRIVTTKSHQQINIANTTRVSSDINSSGEYLENLKLFLWPISDGLPITSPTIPIHNDNLWHISNVLSVVPLWPGRNIKLVMN